MHAGDEVGSVERAAAATTSRAPPGGTSSACWKTKRTSPASSSRRPASSCAAPSNMAVRPSCPHACMTPGRVEAYGRSFSSRIGSASMSARRTTTFPGRDPCSRATTAVPAGRSISRPPNERSVCSTNADVSCSANESSGLAWRWRRHAIARASRSSETSCEPCDRGCHRGHASGNRGRSGVGRVRQWPTPSRWTRSSPSAGDAASCSRRSEIYGGLGSSYDYGHYGVLLKDNVKQRWLAAMVRERDDIVALDSSIILHPQRLGGIRARRRASPTRSSTAGPASSASAPTTSTRRSAASGRASNPARPPTAT